MFDHKHYVPILTAKLGEYRALRVLANGVKDALTPVFETPPIDWDFQNDAPECTIDEQIATVATNIQSHWGDRLAFIDTYPLEAEGNTATGTHHLTHIMNEARTKGVRLIPVTGIARGAAHQDAVRTAIATDGRGVCIRVLIDQVNGELGAKLDNLLDSLAVAKENVDIIVDFGPMEPRFLPSYMTVYPQLTNAVNALGQWRTLTIAGCAFPSSLSGMQADATHRLPRTEWQAWSSSVVAGTYQRRPTFGDYAIDSPEYASLNFRVITISAAIRYTHDAQWVVVKGHGIVKGAPNQFPGLARILRGLPEYCGPAFSWGDQYIDDCATGSSAGPGSGTTWRQVATNHHLTFAVNQIANLAGI